MMNLFKEDIMEDKKKTIYGIELSEGEELFDGFEEEINDGKGEDDDE